MVGLWVWVLCVCGFIGGFGGFAWCACRWHNDAVVVGCLSGRGRKRGRGSEREIVKKKIKLSKVTKK